MAATVPCGSSGMSCSEMKQGTLKFSSRNRLMFAGSKMGMTVGVCNGCRCCGNEVVKFTVCRFNRHSCIKNYYFAFYRQGAYLEQEFFGIIDFQKAPIGGFWYDQVVNYPPGGDKGGACCFCQFYKQIIYFPSGEIKEINFVFGEGRSVGFCYVPDRGWWDGNEATGGPYDGENQVKGGIPCNGPDSPELGCADGTFFKCKTCNGRVTTFYTYYDRSYANVSFDVHNPDCANCPPEEVGEGDTNVYYSSAFDVHQQAGIDMWNSSGWSLSRGTKVRDDIKRSINGALFISGQRASMVASPNNNYSTSKFWIYKPATMKLWVYLTHATTALYVYINGSKAYDSDEASMPVATWTEVTIPLSQAPLNYEIFLYSKHDAANGPNDGVLVDDMVITYT